MTTTASPSTYQEFVRAPTWVYFIFSTPLGVVLAVMTASAVKGLVKGGEAAAFYIVLAFIALLLVYMLVSFTSMVITVTDREIAFAIGVFRKKLPFVSIKSATAADYRWTQFGGWGVRWGFRGKRAWNLPGVKRGVNVAVTEHGQQRTYFISSRTPDDLAKAVQERLQGQ